MHVDRAIERLVSGPLELAGPFAATPSAGEPEMILRTSIKCWPVEYHAQSAVEAALKLRREFTDAAEIESVLIQSHDAAVDIIGSEPEKWRPLSRETADHSLPYITAAALMDADVTQATFAPERYTDPILLNLVQRVTVARHPELSAMYPGAVGNIVTVKLHGGRTIQQRVDHASGHAMNPMSDAAVEVKFHTMANPLLGRERAERLLKWVWQLDQVADVAELFPLMEVPPA